MEGSGSNFWGFLSSASGTEVLLIGVFLGGQWGWVAMNLFRTGTSSLVSSAFFVLPLFFSYHPITELLPPPHLILKIYKNKTTRFEEH